MTEILFLSLEDVLQLHQDAIECDGGTPGLRDRGLIESAIATPRATFDGQDLYPDFAAKTAILMYALVKNHGFTDGNKRVGTMAAGAFRFVNGIKSLPPAAEMEAIAFSVADGKMDLESLTDWWRLFTPS